MPLRELKIEQPNQLLRLVDDPHTPGRFIVTIVNADGTETTPATHTTPKILFNATVKTSSAPDGQPMDIVYTDKAIGFRYVISKINSKTGKRSSEFQYGEIDPTQNTYLIHNENSDARKEMDRLFASGYRLRDKLDALNSLTLKNLLLAALPTQDDHLYWMDIRQINELLFALDAQDNTTPAADSAALLTQLNNLIQNITHRYQLTSEQQDLLHIDENQLKFIRRDIKRVHTLVGINNHYLFDYLKEKKVYIEDPAVIDCINRFVDETPGLSLENAKALQKPDYTKLSSQLTQLLHRNRITHSADRYRNPIQITESEMYYIHKGQIEADHLAQIRNPYLRYYIHQYCPRLKKNAQGYIDQSSINLLIEQLNDASKFSEITPELLAQGLSGLVQETPDLPSTNIPFTTTSVTGTNDSESIPSEIDRINKAQNDLAILDFIVSKIPALGGPLEAILEKEAERTLSAESQTHPLHLHLHFQPPEILTKTLEAIINDMRNGANLYEALSHYRLANILGYEPPLSKNVTGLSKEELQARRKQADEIYHGYLQQILQDTQENCDSRFNYMSLNDTAGNNLSLRVIANSDPTKPGRLLVLQEPPHYAHRAEFALTTLLEPDHLAEPNERAAFGAEKLRGRALWSAEDNKWYQWHWCHRTARLGRISEDGSKAVFVYDTAKHIWKNDLDFTNPMSWPTEPLAFPQRPPLSLREIKPITDKKHIFTDAAGLTAFIYQWKQRLEQHDEKYQPETAAKHLRTLQQLLPSASCEFISQTKKRQLEDILVALPEIERVLTQARDNLLAQQDAFASILAASIDTEAMTLYNEAVKQQAALNKLYHDALEQGIQRYTDMLSHCKTAKSRVEAVLSKTKLGVQTKLAGSVDKLIVDFGGSSAADNTLFVENEPHTRVEPKEYKVQTSQECSVDITTTLHTTRVAFPKEATEVDYYEGFQRGVEFSQGQLPIHIRFNEKNPESKKAAENLRDAALIYLKDMGLDPKTHLLINDKAYQNGALTNVSNEYLTKAREQWSQKSSSAQQHVALQHTVEGLQNIVNQHQTKKTRQTAA